MERTEQSMATTAGVGPRTWRCWQCASSPSGDRSSLIRLGDAGAQPPGLVLTSLRLKGERGSMKNQLKTSCLASALVAALLTAVSTEAQERPRPTKQHLVKHSAPAPKISPLVTRVAFTRRPARVVEQAPVAKPNAASPLYREDLTLEEMQRYHP